MICPHCGYDMGNKNKCIRCGYEVKNLVIVDEQAEHNDEPKEEKPETKIIDPCNVFLTHPYGYEDDYGTGYGPMSDPFAELLDDIFGDPISDLLGGLFGIDLNPFGRRPQRKEPPQEPRKKKKQGPVVEVHDVEIVNDDDEPRSTDEQVESDTSDPESDEPSDNGSSKERKIKNIFKKNKNRK